jgi:hypothetical protein
MTIRSALALSREELGEKIRQGEVKCGFSIVTEARWLDPDDWDRWTIISQDGNRIRLVALSARQPHTGAFTRLIDRIICDRHVPVVVEPNEFLTQWCRKHWFRKRMCGQGELRHVIWYPKRCAY